MMPSRLRPLLLIFLMSIPALSIPVAASPAAPSTAPAQGGPAPTRVVVLGVDHAAQLVSEADQPGMLAAFVARVDPDAICVERAPEEFARGDHYEFTYEIQDVLVPLARRRGTALCPFDWIPSREDMMLGLGLDITRPPEVRPATGFQGFLAFPEPAKLRRTLFSAEDRATLAEWDAWTATPAPKASHDLARRTFLYRTFLQARRIGAAARQWRGRTVLVVVGEFHKRDIEAILADDPAIALVPPSSFGTPDATEVARATTRAHRVAIASFNLLGVQAATGNVDWPWIGRVLDALEAERRDPETALLRTRHARLTGKIDGAAALERYAAIAADPGARRDPAWDGVLDQARIDSYFDPYGNLRIDQRARLELAREARTAGDAARADESLASLRAELTPRQSRQLDAYWQREAPDKP